MTTMTAPTARLPDTALRIATAAHAGTDRLGGLGPYINHPLRVAAEAARVGLPDYAVEAALLHDVLEDCVPPADHDRAVAEWIAAGVSPEAVRLVKTLTKWWGTSGPEHADFKARYYGAIMADPVAAALKVLDRADNLRDSIEVWHTPGGDRTWVRRYLAKTRKEFPAILRAAHHPTVTAAFDAAFTTLAALAGPVDPL